MEYLIMRCTPNYDILGMADLSARYLELSDTKVLCATGEKDGEPIGFGRVGNLLVR